MMPVEINDYVNSRNWESQINLQDASLWRPCREFKTATWRNDDVMMTLMMKRVIIIVIRISSAHFCCWCIIIGRACRNGSRACYVRRLISRLARLLWCRPFGRTDFGRAAMGDAWSYSRAQSAVTPAIHWAVCVCVRSKQDKIFRLRSTNNRINCSC